MEPQLQGGDISIEHFLQDQQDLSTSSLQEVLHGGCVLLTGATGLLGSLILEKLLRSFNGLSKILVTVRGKEGKSAQTRLKELLSTRVFDLVRLQHGEELEKIELIDLDKGFEAQVDPLVASVSMIVHCAVIVDPSHSMREAVDANLKFTGALLQTAYRCRKLESFVMVSSTLCHGGQRVVEERFYPPTVTAGAMFIIADTLSQKALDNPSGLISGDMPASLMTLLIAEDLIRQGRRSLPLAIVRPSMLVATYKEPLAGWLPRGSPAGLTRVLTEAMRGRLGALRCDDSLCADLMPADYAASLTLAVAAHTATVRRNWQNKEVDDIEVPGQIVPDSDIPIFNLVSSNQSPLCWREFFVCSLRHTRNVPFLDMAWYPYLLLTKSKFWFSLWFFVFHLLPATIIDGYRTFTDPNPNILNAKKSRVYRKYTKLRDICEALSPHMLTSQRYRDSNTSALWRSLGLHDRAAFNFDVLQLDWDQFLHTLARGVRLYCLGDSLDTIPRAANRLKRLKLLHYSCVVMSSFFILILFRAVLKVLLF